MKTLVALIVLIALNSSVFAQPDGYSYSVEFGPSKIILPVSYRSGINPVVSVKINGKGIYRFMFDTGSPGLLKLDERVFKLLRLPVTDSVFAGDGSGVNRKAFPVTKIERLELGDFKIFDASAMVRNYNTRAGIDSIDGVIGPRFFEGYVVELNFENSQLIISKDRLTAGADNIYPMRQRNGVPGMKIKIGNKELDADFDSGNMGWLTLPSSYIAKEDMAAEPRVVGQAQTVSNTFEIKEVAINPTLYVGNIQFERPTVVLNDVLPHINMGIRLLKQMNIALDMKSNLIRLTKYEKIPVTGNNNSKSNEFTGTYGDRVITLGDDGHLYIQRPGGMLLKMIAKGPDSFGLEKVPAAAFVFERDADKKVVAIKVGRSDGSWENVIKQ